MKAIMYHYIREYNPNFPNFKFLDIKNFIKQIDFFEKNYGFVSREEWDSFVANGTLPKIKGKVILTFDDAFIDHFDYVFKELKKRDLWGIFYLPTAAFTSNYILDIHLVHLLLGKVSSKELLDQLNYLVTEKMLVDKKNFEEFNLYQDQKDIYFAGKVKKILNFYLNYKFRREIVHHLCKKNEIGFENKNFYLSKEDVFEMKEAGMIFGSQTVNHPVMSRLGEEDQKLEISDSFKWLDENKAISNRTYCHPHGGRHSYNKKTIEILEKLKVLYSFDVSNEEISNKYFPKKMHILPRFDCNQFPFGKI
tara:strand:+ start:16672 stop:17592 length:921 start_codon:yes stop_codon:yes gene_type:complete